MNVDVAIIGAGIVGCATAAAISDAGLRVIAEICSPTEFEPHFSPELVGGVIYPQDCERAA